MKKPLPSPAWNAREGYHCDNSGSFEVFWVDKNMVEDLENTIKEVGWYWWSCQPGCMPDSEANGPFNSSRAAWKDARS